VLFFWQIPHTHAIAIYRQRDYDAAGMKTLPSQRGLRVTVRAIHLFLIVQVAVSLMPYVLGVAGVPYLVTAIALGAMVLAQGFAGRGSHKWARDLFLTSIVYLPVLFAVMVVNGQA
jgi:protoheme IX farnesyltransferase